MAGKHRKKGGHARRRPPTPKALANALNEQATESTFNIRQEDAAAPVEDVPEGGTEAAEQKHEPASNESLTVLKPAEDTTDTAESLSRLDPLQAQRILEVFIIQLIAAGISPSSMLQPFTASGLPLDEFQELLESYVGSLGHNDPPILPAIQTSASDDRLNVVDVSKLLELVRGPSFRVELLEFQVRQAILDKAIVRSRCAVDTQRAVSKLAASFAEDQHNVTSIDFEEMLEQKLGVSVGSSVLVRVIFSRLMRQPFTHRSPKRLSAEKEAFFAALEAYVINKPLAVDSVEGQLRHLLSKHPDLRASFQSLDSDKSGSISVDEFVSFLQREAEMLYPHDVLSAFIQRFDTDSDGALSYDEFIQFISPKQFGIQVLSPFGLFYLSTDRRERMEDVVTKIKTRMFWMQHNDLFSISTQPIQKAPFKLKVTDRFLLAHHYGTLRLLYKPSDPIAKVLSNGELVVLFLESELHSICPETGMADETLPPFEYRLRPKTKRSIPPLISTTIRDSATMDAVPNTTGISSEAQSQPRRVTLSGRTYQNTRHRKPEDDHSLTRSSTHADISASTRARAKRPSKTRSAGRQQPPAQAEPPPLIPIGEHLDGQRSGEIQTPGGLMSPESSSIPSYEYVEDDDGDETAPPLDSLGDDAAVDCDEELPPPYN